MKKGVRIRKKKGNGMNDTINDAVRTLEEAAARMEVRGWRKGANGPVEGPNCIGGVLCWTMNDLDIKAGRVLGAVTSALGHVLPDVDHVTWNDRFCPDQATAVAKLREAAKWLHEEGPHVRA